MSRLPIGAEGWFQAERAGGGSRAFRPLNGAEYIWALAPGLNALRFIAPNFVGLKPHAPSVVPVANLGANPGCPTLATYLFLSPGRDSTNLNQLVLPVPRP
jgi:hypothetical protein